MLFTSGQFLFFDGFYFSEPVTVDKITLYARSAPKGGNLQIAIMKNGSVTSGTAILSQDNQSQTTTLSQPFSFSSTDKFALKVMGVDPQGQAKEITAVIYYQ